jgi:hypothetical protein
MLQAQVFSERGGLCSPGEMIHEYLNKWSSCVQHSQFSKSSACGGSGMTV